MLIPEWLYVLLISIGITVIAVLWYLRHQWLKLLNSLTQLQQYNDQVDRDLIRFLEGICPLLEPISVCGLYWRLQWFGQQRETFLGTTSRFEHTFTINEGDAQVLLTFYVTSSRWEQSFYVERLAEQLRFICLLDIALKMRQVLSFEQAVARYQLFLAHDLKNLAQMMLLWQQDVQATQPQMAQEALQRWQAVAPILGERAEALAKRLSAPGEANRSVSLLPISLSSVLERLQRWAIAHKVRLELIEPIPSLSILANWSHLDDIAFQLMRNYREHCDERAVLLRITQEQHDQFLCLQFCHPMLVDETTLKRMQEPLWSSSPTGLGVGLWQMGYLLERMGGRFAIKYTEQDHVCFHWQFKITEPASL